MSSTGFVNQFYRNMVNWQWYRDPIARSLFEHLLRIVNEDDKMELGICIKSGSVLITIHEIAYAIGFTVKQIRVAMDKLISSHDISIKSIHAKGTIITIEEWHKYQLKINDNLADGNRRATEGKQQVIDNNSLTKMEAFQRATEGQQNTEIAILNQQEGNRRATEGQQQNADIQEDTKVIENKRATEGQQQDQPKESENEDIPPIPPIEVKNNIQEKDKKEEDKSSSIKEKENQPKYRIQFNFETNRFDGITEQDIELWHNAYPAIDIQTEITKAACWLVANPNRKKSNYKQFLNNWLCKAQDRFHPNQPLLQFSQQLASIPMPKNIEDVLAKTQEQNIPISRDEAEKFFNYYQALGWKKNGQPIMDWTALLRNWQSNIGKFDYGSEGQQRTPTPQENSDPWWKNLREP